MMKKLLSQHRHHVFTGHREHGGAALEYIIVSIFGLLLTAASVSLVGRAIKEKLAAYEQELGIELNLPLLDEHE